MAKTKGTGRSLCPRCNVIHKGMRNGPYLMVIAPLGWKGRFYRGRYAYEHHVAWWQKTGEVPKPGEVIHHKDENTHNNDPANLDLLQLRAHSALHGGARALKRPPLLTPEQREWIRTFYEKTGMAAHRGRRKKGVPTLRLLATAFGVTVKVIQGVVKARPAIPTSFPLAPSVPAPPAAGSPENGLDPASSG